MLNKERMNRVLAKLSAPQMLICDSYAVYYLLGKRFFAGERFFGFLIRKYDEPVLFLNTLFRTDMDLGVKVVYYSDGDDIAELLRPYVDAKEVLAVDKTLTANFLLTLMENQVAAGFENGSLAVDMTRAVKDADEIAKMKKASLVNDAAMAQFKKLIHAGVTEAEVAEQTLGIYKSLGASDFSFPSIVAFGENSADPHHMPDDTVLQVGDTVLFDVGCVVDGYCSDMTRTFFYGKEPTNIQIQVYNLVRSANEEAEKMLKPGIPICSIDQKARDIITAGGYGKDFTHRLGHFIGLQDHEFGDVSGKNEDLTEPGNIFSIEPGIYNPDAAGVRIEDLVLITEDGYENLNHYSHDIEVIY